jgi:hypothetical protein
MKTQLEKLTDSLKSYEGVSELTIVAAIDEIAEDLLKDAGSDAQTPDGFAEGVQALQAAIAASLGVETK